ncbi:MAG: FecR domain-containing protein [Nevskia sp.]|nr:FecR domain-containing protein [Nevskia sp.]
MHRLSLILAALLVAGPAPGDDSIGQIKTAAGSVTITRGGTESRAAPGDRVHQADRIATGADGSVGITFADNSMMALGPDSKLDLTRFRFDPTTHEGVFDSSLKSGTLAVKSGQIVEQTPFAMHVQTPAALLGVRGTHFVVRADAGAR